MLMGQDIDHTRLLISGGVTTMDQITKGLLKEFSEERELLALTESKQFEHFCSYSVVRREYMGALDTMDVVVGDTSAPRGAEERGESGGDTTIDGIGIIVNGVLATDLDELAELDHATYWDVVFVLLQAETASSFDTGKLAKFAAGVLDFFSDNPLFKRSESLSRLAAVRRRIYDKSPKFIRGNPICKTYYITTGRLKEDDQNMNAHASRLRSNLEDTGLFSLVEFTPLGAAGIQRLYHRTKHAATATFNFPNRVTLNKAPGVEQAYSGFLSWSEYRKIISTDDGTKLNTSLFFDNIRDWQGFNEVNKEIKECLNSEDKSRFVLMNNGVTVIARELRPTGDTFSIGDYQIVNGCQTTNVLFDQRLELNDSVSVPIRLINTKDERIINSITKATNRQTRIKPEQLFALQEYPKVLETFFASFDGNKRLYFERRDRQYDYAQDRSAGNIQQTRVTSFADMIRAFAAMFLNEPHRTTRNFAGIKAKVGKEIFVRDHRMELYYAAAYALYKTRFSIRTGRIKREFSPAVFHIILAMRILIAGYDRPAFKAKSAAAYCDKILNTLYDSARCDEIIIKAARLVEESGRSLDRDDIRTEPFTERVIERAKEVYSEG